MPRGKLRQEQLSLGGYDTLQLTQELEAAVWGAESGGHLPRCQGGVWATQLPQEAAHLNLEHLSVFRT